MRRKGGGAPPWEAEHRRKNRFCEDELLHVGKDLLDLALVGLVELAEGLAGQADIVEALSLQRVLADLLPVRHAVDLAKQASCRARHCFGRTAGKPDSQPSAPQSRPSIAQ